MQRFRVLIVQSWIGQFNLVERQHLWCFSTCLYSGQSLQAEGAEVDRTFNELYWLLIRVGPPCLACCMQRISVVEAGGFFSWPLFWPWWRFRKLFLRLIYDYVTRDLEWYCALRAKALVDWWQLGMRLRNIVRSLANRNACRGVARRRMVWFNFVILCTMV